MATKALLNIASRMKAKYFAIETQANQAFLEDNNMITFTDEDMEVRHLEHKGPLYLVATINQTPIKISHVDTEAFVSLIQLRTLEVAEIPKTKIQEFPKFSLTHFHMVKPKVSYQVLLEWP